MKSTGHNPGRTRFVVAERGFVVPKQTEQAGVIDLPVGGVEKAARNQVVFREVNERIAELTGLFNETGVNLFICECSDPACTESLEVSAGEYEAVRADGARFLVLSGHQIPELERVVDGNGRFLVVETIGQAAEIAQAGNPRTS
jgi:hypothetical protein